MKQERWAVLILAVLLALGLSGCGEAKRLAGEVLEVRTDEAGALTGFVLERGDGRCFGVEMTEETRAFPPWEGTWYSNEEIRADFQSALQLGCGVSVYYQSRGEAMTSQDGQKLTAYVAQQVNIESTLERDAVTLADGTVVDLRRACTAEGSRNYQLPDGTGLLWVYDGGGPERHYVAGQESLDDLSEAARERVQAYYEKQGPQYDEMAELEKSYAAYLELGEEFEGDSIRRDVSPCASNGRVLYLLTSLTLPQEYGTRLCYERQSGGAFDRETGEKIENWDLFAVPEEEVRRRLPELCGWVKDRNLREAMGEALEADMFVFFPSCLSVSFPPGSLPGEENTCIISVDYKDVPEGFFQPWAVPVAPEM